MAEDVKDAVDEPVEPTEEELEDAIDPVADKSDREEAVKTAMAVGQSAAEGAEEKEKTPTAADIGEPPAEGEEEQQPEAQSAPITWDPKDQEMFNGLPPAAQARISELVQSTEQRELELRQSVAPMAQALDYWTPFAQNIGADPLQMFNDAMSVVHTLRTGTNQQKIGVLQKLAADFGVEAPEPEIDPKQDPYGVQRQIRDAEARWRQENDQLRAQLQQNSAQQQNAGANAVMAELTAFRDEKAADGKTPAHPFFSEALPHMQARAGQFAAAGQQIPPVAQLYDEVCWANPSIRAKMQAAANAQAKSKRKNRTTVPGLAGGSAKGAKERPAPMKDKNDFTEDLRQVYREMSA